MDIYYLMLEAKPAAGNPDRHEFAGAYVNCWVKASSCAKAMTAAKAFINQEGWLYTGIEETCIASRDAYLDDPDSLASFDEAVEDGFSATFYTWPIN